MDFIEYMNKVNNKFGQLKIRQATYSKGNCVELQLLFPDKFGSLSDEEKDEILKLANDYVENKYNITIKYKKSYVDVEVIWVELQNFLDKEIKFADNLLTKNNIEVKQIDSEQLDIKQNENYDNYNVIIKMSKSLYKFFEEQDFVNKLREYLNSVICANFSITIDPTLEEKDLQSVLKENDNRQTELSILRDMSLKNEDKYYEFELGEYLIGQVSDNSAIRLDQISTINGRNIIAGTLKFFNEVKFPDKKDNTKEKVMYTLTVEDFWGKLRCVYFPNQNTIELIKKLKEGDQIAIMGDYETYNGNSSFKVNSIAYANLGQKPEEHIEWRKPFDEYLVVQPEEYVEVSQMSLLDNKEVEVSDYLKQNDIVVFDFETTGLNVDDSYILELGAVKIHNGKLTETFETLVKPPVKIPPEITELTHITEEMVANAPSYELVLADFYKFTRGCILSAYNIDFDAKFLEKYGRSILFNFDNERIDTLLIARQKVKGLPNYKLKTVVNHLNIELVSAHRALDDAVACAKVFQRLM